METDIRCLQCSERFPAHVVAQFGGSCPACVAGFAETAGEAALKMGATFGRYVVGEPIGRGGMGVVYRARQEGLDRDVALKVLSPRLAADADFVRRFEREARTLASLNHPNIVAVYDTGVEGGTPYLAMELVEGVSLRRLLAERRLPPEEALGIVPQLCDALEYAHAKGVVHRDIKPENILIDAKGRVKIADYGLAVMLGIEASRLTQTQSVLGTPHYMAPEQVESPRTVDHRADIYSMGVVFYEMLTGELPLGHFSMPSTKAKVHRRLDEIVARALAKEPERRYQTAAEVKSDVAAAPRTPGPAPGGEFFEWRSKTTVLGWPLVHVNLRRGGGRVRVARGILAFGDLAIGVVAAGGMAIGGLAIGGASLGLLAIGGLALAAAGALGGAAIAGGVAYGGLACAGYAAYGGGAYAGRYAMGGEARAKYVTTGERSDPEAERFFARWGSGMAQTRLEHRSKISEVARQIQARARQMEGEPYTRQVLAAARRKEAEAYIERRDYAEAMDLLKMVPRETTDFVLAQRLLGLEVFTRGLKRPLDGLPHLHRALAENPEDEESWKALEEACRAAGVPFERAIPKEEAYREGRDAYEAGEHGKAWSLLARTPRGHVDFAKAYRFVGYNLFVREWNRPLEGLPYLDQAYEVAPNDPKVLQDITRAYEKAGLPFTPRKAER
jgi:tetratricopeptide (TPR) repeat protein